MATYYVDYEGGNNANAGTSFATRWQTIAGGATTARIAPGDTIRVMASPDPTSIGNATWTGGGRPTAKNINSSTNATPIVITTATAHGLVPGDYVAVIGHATNTNANGIWKVGATSSSTTFEILQLDGSNTTGNGTGSSTGTVTKANNLIVKTATPLVQNIALCGGQADKPIWTASTNVVTARQTVFFKEGYSCLSIAPNATFTTGKAAYYTTPSTLTLSGYQQVSFWVMLNSGTVGAAGQTYLALCSDSVGDVVVYQCPIPSLGATGSWVPVTVNLGVNMTTPISSIAFYVSTDVGAQTFYIDNIVACKAASSADSITLQSLVSKSDGTGNEAWYAIQSLNYDTIMLSNGNNFAPSSGSIRGYSGTSETVTSYKRETIKTVIGSVVATANDSGVAGSPITFSGGWNRTDMSTQTGRTWLDGVNNSGTAFEINARSFINVDKIDFCRYNSGITVTNGSSDINIQTVYATSNTAVGAGVTATNSYNITGNSWFINNNGSTGISFAGYVINIDYVLASNNSTSGLNYTTGARYINIVDNTCSNCGSYGSAFSGTYMCTSGSFVSEGNGIASVALTNAMQCEIGSGRTAGNQTAGIRFLSATSGSSSLYANNFVVNDVVEVTGITTIGAGSVYINRLDDTDNNSWIWAAGFGVIDQQTTIIDSPASTAWRMRCTGSITSAVAPLRLKLGTVVCAANSLVTVTARMRRDNTGLTMRLVCPGGQISGVSSNVFSDMTAAADTWETVTITFTPTKAGGVDIYAYAFGGTTYSGYVCNLTASQA